jgi:hypothetical protein
MKRVQNGGTFGEDIIHDNKEHISLRMNKTLEI